ncbi:MAG TPA: VOC family protein [Thermoleophilaceae bacterium]
MPERDGYIPGVPCWIDTSQPDPKAAVDFYGPLFGWEFEDVMPPDAPGEYFIGRIRGLDVGAVGSIPEGAPQMAVWNTYIWVDSADDTAAKVKEAGGSVMMEPFDVMGAGRMAALTDPEGAVFLVWEAKDHKGSQIVNEHGSNNFNNLNTRDLESAKAFYGSVFGWKTLDLDRGAVMWALPGYGDHLEELSPGLRKGMEEMGAPRGFEDVVAGINLISDDQPDTPAHWGLTFAVDDADEIASKAEELGGKVVMPPFDAPWVRMAVIADPQGATFVASKFVPENRDLQPAEQGASAA